MSIRPNGATQSVSDLMQISDQAIARNAKLLDHIELIGGSYCLMDSPIFGVNLITADPTDDDVVDVPDLTGVEVVALNARQLSFPALHAIARIPGLYSLVISNYSLTDAQIDVLRASVPDLMLIGGDAGQFVQKKPAFDPASE